MKFLLKGLLQLRPLIVRGEDMDFSKFGSRVVYEFDINASAVFLHMHDKLVWGNSDGRNGASKLL
ncbi:hypothetical protein NC652_012475 [Populus alba x Populus x berolinensis]|nr:hypothetical protein NC652_012475 [Populus alba x Populus x berolinensis]